MAMTIKQNGLATNLALALVLVLVAVLSHRATAQSGCTSSLLGLTPCLNYVSGNSSTPSSTCCSRLAGIVQSQPQCLCLLLNGTASSYGYNINQTQALALPGACKVETPPVSRCNAVTPSSSPTSSPADNTPTTSSTPSTPGSKNNVPTESTGDGNTSDATKLSHFSMAFTLLSAAYFTFIFN